jgi:phage repressor protein C with HTH and peptisase S24 domain
MTGDEIKRRREALGWSQSELADRSKVKQQTISWMESKREFVSKSLAAVVQALADAEGASRGDVMAGKSNLTVPTPAIHISTQVHKTMGLFPVFGAVEAGGGMSIVTSDPVEYRPMPPHLGSVLDAYGVFIQGESMVPRYEPGEVVEVAPHRPMRHNIDVVLQSTGEDGERRALVKRLLRWTDTEWHVRQYNPQKDYVLLRSEWPLCHVVVGRQIGSG